VLKKRLRGEFGGGFYRDSSIPGSLAASALPTTPRQSDPRKRTIDDGDLLVDVFIVVDCCRAG